MSNKMFKFFLIYIVIFVSFTCHCDGRNVVVGYKRLPCDRLKRDITAAATTVESTGSKDVIEKIAEVTEGSTALTKYKVEGIETAEEVTTDDASTMAQVPIELVSQENGMEESDIIVSALIENRLTQAVEVENLSDFPYIASVQGKQNDSETLVLCTGVLLNQTHVLTTAKCIASIPNIENILIRLGSLNSYEGGITRNVIKVLLHPDFKSDVTNLQTSVHDIAVLEMDKPVLEENGIYYANISGYDKPEIHKLEDLVSGKTVCKAAGFGVTSLHKSNAGTLRSINTTLLDWNSCNVMYSDGIQNKSQVCGTLEGENKGSCFYDEGGPLICDGKIYGMFVFSGISLDCNMKPDVFVRSDSFTSFLYPRSLNETFPDNSTLTAVTEKASRGHSQATKKLHISMEKSTETTMTPLTTTRVPKKLVAFEIPEGAQQKRQPLCEQLRRPPPGVTKPTCIDSPPGCCPEECFEGLGRKRKWRHGNRATSKHFNIIVMIPAMIVGMFHIVHIL